MMVVEETAFAAAPKGQAHLANSQAKEPQPDQTLESTPPMRGCHRRGPIGANLSGKKDRGREDFVFLCLF